MNNFGKNIRISIFGESHGSVIGLTIDGLPPKLTLDEDDIKKALANRQGTSSISTPRVEENKYQIISGYFNNQTTGAPLTIIIPNMNVDDSAYTEGIIRPSHADYPYYLKFDGAADYRGGGTSSGRLTAVLVILGSICKSILKEQNITVISRIKGIKDVVDKTSSKDITEASLLKLINVDFPVLDERAKKTMLDTIKKARNNNETLGGMVETFILNLPPALGEPFFDSFESILSHLLFSIPGVKGLLFGDGVDLAVKSGSKMIDEMAYVNGKVTFASNHQGGINGGITNGNIVNFTTILRAPASFSKPVNSIDVIRKENISVTTIGRHDVTFVHRALHVINALTYYAVLEMVMENEKHR